MAALHTVRITIDAKFQNGLPFDGVLRLRLSRAVNVADGGGVVIPREWQEVQIRADKPDTAEVELIPNALLGEGTFYHYELVQVCNTGAYQYDRYGKRRTAEKGAIVVPDRDCDISELITLPPTNETAETAEAFASEAKQAAADAEAAAERAEHAQGVDIDERLKPYAKTAEVAEQYVKKDGNKGLSSNDFTDAQKTKLDGVEAGAQKNPDLTPYAKTEALNKAVSEETTRAKAAEKVNAEAATNAANKAKTAQESADDKIPLYDFADAVITDGVLTIPPYKVTTLISDGSSFTVKVGEEPNGKVRDCLLIVDCTNTDTAPTITWEKGIRPRTDAATDMECVAGVRNVFWLSKYAPASFVIAGWAEQEEAAQ